MVGLSVSKGNQLGKYDHDVDILFLQTVLLFCLLTFKIFREKFSFSS